MSCPFGPPPPPTHAPPLVTIVLELGNSCQCYGCLQKTSRVLNKFPGVKKHSYNLERNQIKLTGTVDPDVVVMKISKIKKHVKLSAVIHPTTDHMPPLSTQPQLPPPMHGRSGSCYGCDNVHPQPPHCGLMQGPMPSHDHNGSCRGCNHTPPPPVQGGPTQGPLPPSHQPPLHGHSYSRFGCDHAPPPAHGGPTQVPPPPHGHSCSARGCQHAPPPLAPAAQPPRQSVHIHVTENGKSPIGHPPPPLRHNCVNGPPPPPPSSAFHCPPPQHHRNAAATHVHPPPPNNPGDQLDKFLHGPSSPLITHNVRYTSILGHLAKIPKLKNVELIKKKGIKFRLQDGKVKSCCPINHMEVRPVHDCAALPHHYQHPPRFINHFSDENVKSSCTIM